MQMVKQCSIFLKSSKTNHPNNYQITMVYSTTMIKSAITHYFLPSQKVFSQPKKKSNNNRKLKTKIFDGSYQGWTKETIKSVQAYAQCFFQPKTTIFFVVNAIEFLHYNETSFSGQCWLLRHFIKHITCMKKHASLDPHRVAKTVQ